MVSFDLADLESALNDEMPPGPLTTVRLPMVVSTTGARMHSYEAGDSCRELRMWGGRDAQHVDRVTLAELTGRVFVNNRPVADVCDSCYGDDLHRVDTHADLLLRAHAKIRHTWPSHARSLRQAYRDGDHRSSATGRNQTLAWQSLGALRLLWDTSLYPPGKSLGHDRFTDQATASDPALGRRYRAELDSLIATSRELSSKMLEDRAGDDRDSGAELGPLQLAVPSTGGASWTVLPGPAGRWIYPSDPVGWLTLMTRRGNGGETSLSDVPVFAVPYDERTRALPGLRYLGDAQPHLARLAETLEVTSQVYNDAHTKDPLHDTVAAFQVAAAIVAPAGAS